MILIQNAKIYTLEPNNPQASALLIDHGKILAVGDSESLMRDYQPISSVYLEGNKLNQVIDLEGRTVIPGLVDAHIHLEHYSLALQKIDCETETKEACLLRIKERVEKTPPGTWILGHGWNQNNWEAGFGTLADLDAIASEHPVYLTAKSLHAAWANSVALRLANITSVSEDPPDGGFGRDEQGRLNGILFESAMDEIGRVIPEPSVEQVMQAIQNAQPILWKMGLTGVHDFDRRRCFTALQTLHQGGLLKLRVIKSIPLEDLAHVVALGLRTGFGDDLLRIGGIKAFADGALGPQTAAMIQPYEGSLTERGMLFLDAEELYEYGRQAVQNGLHMAVHAIGDRANHEVLDAFDHLRTYEAELNFMGMRDQAIKHGLRHRIEHVQLIHPDDVARLAELGIVASMQPIHATSDMYMADRYWGKRSRWSYAWQAQLNQNAILAFGSDAPVESPNPFWGIHAAVTRQRRDGSPGKNGWYPEERLLVTEAIGAYTLGPAIATNQESKQGKLAAGYLADLVVLNENPFTVDVSDLHQIESVATMVNGEWVYSEIDVN